MTGSTKRNKKPPIAWDPLSAKVPSGIIVLAALRSKDRNCQPHAVAFYDETMVDCCRPYAAKITHANLDMACGGSGKYNGLAWTKMLSQKNVCKRKATDEGVQRAGKKARR